MHGLLTVNTALLLDRWPTHSKLEFQALGASLGVLQGALQLAQGYATSPTALLAHSLHPKLLIQAVALQVKVLR